MRLCRWFWRGLGALVGLLLATALFYIVVVNPSHWRVRRPELPALQPFPQYYRRIGSLLSSGLVHTVDVDAARYASARADLAARLHDEVLLVESQRFVSPYQMYYSAGLYPYRLEAQDALYIPEGASLRFAMPSDATQLRLAALSPGAAGRLRIESSGAEPVEVAIADAISTTGSAETLLDRLAVGVFSVDKAESLTRWAPVRLGARGSVTITCRDAAYGCLVGDPGFYATAEPGQNVVVILVDTMRWDALQGGTAPALERLAATSTTYTNALAPGNMTAPSTNALLACQKAGALTGVAFAYAVDAAHREAHYARHRPSFPAVFAAAGYDTAMIGNVSVISEAFGVGVSHGFARQISIEVDPFDTPLISREAVEWLAQHGDSRFLLYVHFNGPHAPYRAPWSNLWRVSRGLAHDVGSYASSLLWLYRGEISYTDDYVADVLEALRRLGLDERTSIVLTADHGDQHAVRRFGENVAAEAFTGSYFDHGATLYNDEIRVPLVVRRAGQTRGHRETDYVSTLAIGPTLLQSQGLAVPSYCDAMPLSEVGDSAGQRSVIGSEGFRGRAIVLDGRWKYIRTYEPTDKRVFPPTGWSSQRRLFLVPEELFDLATDPLEERNLVATEIAMANRAREAYRRYYGIKDGFELVIDDPQAVGFEARLDSDGAVVASRDGVAVDRRGSQLVVSGRVAGRTLLTLRGPLNAVPTVLLGGQPAVVGMTALRLPLAGTVPAELPVEAAGSATLLPPPVDGAVLLRRIEDDGQGERRIMTGNARFESVLRQWGYLNDQ